MDTQKFDAIAKSLAAGKSRRSVIGGLFGGAFAMAGLSRVAAAPMEKVDICHYDEETSSYHVINVSGNALNAHMAHGDYPAGEVACMSHQQASDEGCSCVCKVYETEQPRCYWMETFTGDYCWIPEFAEGLNEEQCAAANSGCGFGGACYGWGTSTEGLSS